MNRWERVLWQMGRQSICPNYLDEITECGTTEHRLLTQDGSILTVGGGEVFYGLGSIHPGTDPIASKRDDG